MAAAVALVLGRVLPRFVERYPKVEVDVRVDNELVDIVAEGLDAGVRLVEAIDRDMIHVRLAGPCRVVVAAAPSYLKRRGTPQKPHDLLQHDCLRMRFTASGKPWAWELERGKKTWRVPVRGPVTTNDHELRRLLAVAGVGLFYTLEPAIADELARRRLRVVLEPYFAERPGAVPVLPEPRADVACVQGLRRCRARARRGIEPGAVKLY